ncbi:hypothetical protein DFH11DRAFT_1612437 [Phellopilus nigrolimitatus]|nr:hypothetical protein DFH11DRAFT_1612437 [Phellopilus nigrolimitatus]
MHSSDFFFVFSCQFLLSVSFVSFSYSSCIELRTYLRGVAALRRHLLIFCVCSFPLYTFPRIARWIGIFILFSLNVCPHTCLKYILLCCSSLAVGECFVKPC